MMRSWLFVPADAADKLAKAPERGADALVIDLEDAVAPDRKRQARDVMVDWIDSGGGAERAVWVRVNNQADLLDDDLDVAARAGVAGIVVPKVAGGRQAAEIGARIPRGIGFVAMIETALAVLEAPAIATAQGVTTLMVGEYDLAAELGMDPSPDRRELAPIRAAVVLACSAAGVAPPIGPVSADFQDLDAFRQSCEALRREGHWGRAVIHPAQIGPANEAFTPDADDVARARRLLELHAAALAGGSGVGVDDDGNLIDEAIVRTSRHRLAAAEAAGVA